MTKQNEKTIKQIRSGRGKANYERERKALMRHCKANNIPCIYCGQPFDWTITDHTDRGYFSANHPMPLEHGGSLTGQELEPMHRGCNSALGSKVIPKGNLPTTDLFN